MNILLYNKNGEKWRATPEEYEEVERYNGWSRALQSDGWSTIPPFKIRIRAIIAKLLKKLSRR